jgi:hypothetical protein
MAHPLFLSALAASALAAAPAGVRLDVKPGLWEVRSTTSMKLAGDLPSVDPGKLSPEQRARLEALRERMASGKPHTTVRQACVTQEELDRGQGFEDWARTEGCERTFLDRTPRHVHVQVKCASTERGATSEGDFEVTVKSADSVVMRGEMKTHTRRRDSAGTTDMAARRLGASCGDVKPGQPRTISD